MAVKKFPATGWMPFRKVKNRKIRKYRLAKVKYSSLPEQLEQNEGHDTDQRGCGHGLDDGFSDTAVILRPVVEARDGLHTLGETDGDGEEDHVYLADDTGAGQRNLTSVDGLAAVEYQDIVHDHLYDHDSQLIQEG